MMDTSVKRQASTVDKSAEIVARVSEGRRQAAELMLADKSNHFSPAGLERLKKIATA